MGDDRQIRRSLEVVSSVLLRCFILGLAFLVLWFFLFVVLKDTTYAMHGSFFAISKKDFDILNYYGIAVVKGVVFVAFLIPYLATRLVLRSLSGREDLPAEE